LATHGTHSAFGQCTLNYYDTSAPILLVFLLQTQAFCTNTAQSRHHNNRDTECQLKESTALPPTIKSVSQITLHATRNRNVQLSCSLQ
jgi:hypothetical protein